MISERVSLAAVFSGIAVASYIVGYGMCANLHPQIHVNDDLPYKSAQYPSVKFDFANTDDLNAFMEAFKKDGGWNFGPNGSFPNVQTVEVDDFYIPPCAGGKAHFLCGSVVEDTNHGPHPRHPQ